jgi:hypothetical protein
MPLSAGAVWCSSIATAASEGYCPGVMCNQCITQAEAIILNSAGVAALSLNAWTSLRERFRDPATPAVRAQRKWDRTASSLRELGFDPVATLGPRPLASVPPSVVTAGDLSGASELDGGWSAQRPEQDLVQAS